MVVFSASPRAWICCTSASQTSRRAWRWTCWVSKGSPLGWRASWLDGIIIVLFLACLFVIIYFGTIAVSISISISIYIYVYIYIYIYTVYIYICINIYIYSGELEHISRVWNPLTHMTCHYHLESKPKSFIAYPIFYKWKINMVNSG